MVMFFRSIRRWYLEKTTSVVVMTTGIWDGGSVEEYAIRKRKFVFPFFFKYEYLDLSIIDNNAGNWNKNQGSMYGDTTGVPKYKRNVSTKDKIHWWDKPETILKYCTSPDLDLVVNAQKSLFYYIKPNPQKLPTATAITDVNFELAQFKLRGGHKEKKV